MKIDIIENNDNNVVVVKCGSYKIDVSSNSNEWNNEGINKFLVNISVAIPNNEKFLISEFNNNSKNDIYRFVWELFNDFVIEYNKTIELS